MHKLSEGIYSLPLAALNSFLHRSSFATSPLLNCGKLVAKWMPTDLIELEN